MAKTGSDRVSWFLVDGLNLVGVLTQFESRQEAKVERNDVLGGGFETQAFTGVRESQITQEGFYDDDAGSVHDALTSGPGQSRVMSYAVEGTATGARFTGFAGAMQINYGRQVARDSLTKARAEYRGNGPFDEGRTLFPWKAVGSTGRKNSVDGSASSTGGAGYLHYNATAGECNVRILHSSDDVTYATLFTFAKASSGHGAERLTTTGTIERYTAADFTTASATGAISVFNAFVGLVRGLSS